MKRIASLLCAILILASLSATACAAQVTPWASDYFGCTSVRAYAVGSGKVLIEFGIDATHKMEEVGASVIHIYKQQTDGSYSVVYTYTKATYPNLIETNSYFGYGDITYQGVSGCKYYALVGCYAKDSNGSETLYFATNVVTA